MFDGLRWAVVSSWVAGAIRLSAVLRVGQVALTIVVSAVAFLVGQMLMWQCYAMLEERLRTCGEQAGPRPDYSF